jgi:hypothetical protein
MQTMGEELIVAVWLSKRLAQLGPHRAYFGARERGLRHRRTLPAGVNETAAVAGSRASRGTAFRTAVGRSCLGLLGIDREPCPNATKSATYFHAGGARRSHDRLPARAAGRTVQRQQCIPHGHCLPSQIVRSRAAKSAREVALSPNWLMKPRRAVGSWRYLRPIRRGHASHQVSHMRMAPLPIT